MVLRRLSIISAFMLVGTFDVSALTVNARLSSDQELLAEDFARLFSESNELRTVLANPLTCHVSVAVPARPDGVNLRDLPSSDPEVLIRRWVTFTYYDAPPHAPPDEILAQIDASGYFEAIEVAPSYELSFAINDQLYSNGGSPNPNKRQWGIDALNLSNAFDRTLGRALISAVDSGIPGRVNSSGVITDSVHPDLEPASQRSNIRRHLSYTVAPPVCGSSPQALSIEFPLVAPADDLVAGGHGSHVAGIMTAKANSTGVIGACPECSFLMMRSIPISDSSPACFDTSVQYAQNNGVTVINMSWGRNVINSFNPPLLLQNIADSAAGRDVALVAASGNYASINSDYPARFASVTSVGAASIDGAIGSVRPWDESVIATSSYPHDSTLAPGCTLLPPGGIATPPSYGGNSLTCGSSRGVDLAAPGAQILSTIKSDYVPRGTVSQPEISPPCTNRLDPLNPIGNPYSSNGLYGVCTGTSMAAPFVTSLAGLVRSINPLLSWQSVLELLAKHAVRPSAYTVAEMGAGVPNAAASLDSTLGRSEGQVVPNRLIPVFSYFSRSTTIPSALGQESWIYTTSPQTGMAALTSELYLSSVNVDGGASMMGTFLPVQHFAGINFPSGSYTPATALGTQVLGYNYPSSIVKKLEPPQPPSASFYIFATEKHPLGESDADLVPLYRMSAQCRSYRKHTYAVGDGQVPGVAGTREYFEGLGSSAQNCESSIATQRFRFDLVEGYIWRAYTSVGELIPQPLFTVPLYRRYNATTKSWALVLGTELGHSAYAGYSDPLVGRSLLGYVYSDGDADQDGLNDGMEKFLDTSTALADTDGDGVSDGVEYPLALPQLEPSSTCPVGLDPLDFSQAGCADLGVTALTPPGSYRAQIALSTVGTTVQGATRIEAVVVIASPSTFSVGVHPSNFCVPEADGVPHVGQRDRYRCFLDDMIPGVTPPQILDFPVNVGSSAPTTFEVSLSLRQVDTNSSNNSVTHIYP